mgnify:CR=1 FL=1
MATRNKIEFGLTELSRMLDRTGSALYGYIEDMREHEGEAMERLFRAKFSDWEAYCEQEGRRVKPDVVDSIDRQATIDVTDAFNALTELEEDMSHMLVTIRDRAGYLIGLINGEITDAELY